METLLMLEFIESLSLLELVGVTLLPNENGESKLVNLARAHLMTLRMNHHADPDNITTEFERRKMAEKCEYCVGRQPCVMCAQTINGKRDSDHSTFLRLAFQGNGKGSERNYF